MKHIKLVSFTKNGAETLERIASLLEGFLIERYERTVDPSLSGTLLSRFAQQAMFDCEAIIFVGAAGIAVRAVSPYLRGKAYDPAVIVADEAGRYIIPILSGHLGGANVLASYIARGLGAEPVITTATDINGMFAVDAWAAGNGLEVYDPENIRYISGAVLRGVAVGLLSVFPVNGALPENVTEKAGAGSGIYIGYDVRARPYGHTLHLIPKVLHLGIGCRRGVGADKVEQAVAEALERIGVPYEAIKFAASVDVKRLEPGLLMFCGKHKLEFRTFPAEELELAEGDFAASEFVKSVVGVDNVCERAAVLSSKNGRLILRKTVYDGVTIAIAEEKWEVRF